MASVAAAAVAAASFAALLAGHHLGDHVVQLRRDSLAKGSPTRDRLATGTHPWTGWTACARHTATYLATQATALGLVAVVTPLGWAGTAAALAASGTTHAVIDRRWPVRLLIRIKGCDEWAEAPYLLDQSLHIGVLLVAAVLAATIASPAGLGVVVAAGATVIVAALVVERRAARAAQAHPPDPLRM
ncbi:MAG TPA: DUF3307 domain-containing protein [Rugosimonospora sp.]|nr:DUF3307 domain-containing protein [Rugosimonospora sp.]